jgi:hypothetical protein
MRPGRVTCILVSWPRGRRKEREAEAGGERQSEEAVMSIVLVVLFVSVAVVNAVIIGRAVARIRLERAVRARPLRVDDWRPGTYRATGFRWLGLRGSKAPVGRRSGLANEADPRAYGGHERA